MVEKNKQVEKKPLICLCVPIYNNIPASWLQSFLNFIQYNVQKFNLDIILHQDNPVDKSRNSLINTALSKNPDYILFLDSDNTIQETGLERMIKVMEEKKADLITALYFEKSKPYYPVIREYHSGGFWKIENPPLGQIIEVAGCGMGCALIKPDIFRKIPQPWFKFNHEKWGYKDIQISEDLYFCRELLNRKMKMFCDTGLISSHIGSTVDVFEFMSFATIREEVTLDRDELIKDVINFTKQTEEEVNLKIMVGPKLIADEWNEKDPKTPEEMKKFYQETENYLYDLTLWHFTTRRKFDVEILTAIKENLKPRSVLDFGCGIGQNAIMLARAGIDVTLAELDSKTLDFAIYRMKEHKVPYKLWKVDVDKNPPEKDYDVILCFDVLEHLPKEEMKKTIRKLISLKNKNTKVLYSVNFGKTEHHPMHQETDEEINKLLEELRK